MNNEENIHTQSNDNGELPSSELSNSELPGPEKPRFERTGFAVRIMAMSGYVLLSCSAGLLTFLVVSNSYHNVPEPPNSITIPIIWFLQNFGFVFFGVIGSIVLGLFGIRLLGVAGKATLQVIPPEDRKLLEPLISKSNSEAIKQYVILSSLSGITGTFQKIGFSGLPLATVTLTLIFSALSFVQPAFLELAKLTLGAFIGSFVQKGQSNQPFMTD